MDQIDRNLLNIIQSDFPIDVRPYDVLANRLGISADEALRRVSELFDAGVIRKIGPSFDTRKLGHVNTLVAAKVDHDRLEEVAIIVSAYPEVTHNYGRNFDYNLWFTLVCESREQMDALIEEIESISGIADLRILPAERTFKIKVGFEF